MRSVIYKTENLTNLEAVALISGDTARVSELETIKPVGCVLMHDDYKNNDVLFVKTAEEVYASNSKTLIDSMLPVIQAAESDHIAFPAFAVVHKRSRAGRDFITAKMI